LSLLGVDFDEYGNPADGQARRYGWLGSKQRSSDDLGLLTLMGVRLYNPATGRFLSVDSIPGGTDNPYAYVLNPTNQFDLSGLCNDRTTACIMLVLTTSEPYPTGFISWLRRRGGDARFAMTKAGMRAMRVNGDHCSKSPDTGWAWNFKNACDTHDLGYDLLRFFRMGGAARIAVDGLFLSDMSSDCKGRSFINRKTCQSTAHAYWAAIAANSLSQYYGVPG